MLRKKKPVKSAKKKPVRKASFGKKVAGGAKTAVMSRRARLKAAAKEY